jgi:hypothetical protein
VIAHVAVINRIIHTHVGIPTLATTHHTSPSHHTMSAPISNDEADDIKVDQSSTDPDPSSLEQSFTASPITATSNHVFDTYADLQSFVTEHATTRGFEVRWRPTGGVEKPTHGGTARCWCSEVPPSADAPAALSSFPPARPRRTSTSMSKASKQMKSGCRWSVCFLRHRDLTYHLTTRELIHNHDLRDASSMSNIDSLRKITPAITKSVRIMINNGMHGVENERRYLEELHGVRIDRDVFHNLINKTKRQLHRRRVGH